jgi:nitrite reductase/ring-hydroxylating ferredoxin subunit
VANRKPVTENQGSERSSGKSTEKERAAHEMSGRRDFLTRAGHLVLGACGLTAAAGALRLATPDFSGGAQRRLPLGFLADFKMNTLTWLRDKDLFVTRNETGFGAFSSKCTHLGCTVQRTAEGFLCPCHGALYDSVGNVVKGPAREPLPWFHVWLEADGRLYVDLGTPLEASGPQPMVLPGKGER